MNSTLKRRLRALSVGVIAALGAGGFSAVVANPAQAYSQVYCGGYVAALDYCPSSGLHSWYYNQAGTNSGQTVCVYMWNAVKNVVRGNQLPCDYIQVSQTFNRTSDQWYNARVYNGTYGVAIPIAGYAVA